MRPFLSIERLANPIGFDIGQSNSAAQAELLNGLAAGLLGSDYTKNALYAQCAYIAQDLTDDAKQVLVNLARFCTEEENQ